MENHQEVRSYEFISFLLNAIAFGISPILMIWGINTLFSVGIPMSFKTWLAGLILIMLIRFHIRPSYYGSEYSVDYEFEEDDDSIKPKMKPEERKGP
jgi:hypothetical protein